MLTLLNETQRARTPAWEVENNTTVDDTYSKLTHHSHGMKSPTASTPRSIDQLGHAHRQNKDLQNYIIF